MQAILRFGKASDTMSTFINNNKPTPETPALDKDAVDTSDKKRSEFETIAQSEAKPKEYGGRSGPDPVRYGDWESRGRCVDF